MKFIRKEPSKDPEMVEIKNELESLQKAVGGYIECVTFPEFIVICDEEGRLKGKRENCSVKSLYLTVPFAGTILVAGDGGDDFTDCPLTVEEFKERIVWEL